MEEKNKLVKMSFVKGIIVGAGITATAYMMYSEGMLNKRKMVKQARKLVHKMGMN